MAISHKTHSLTRGSPGTRSAAQSHVGDSLGGNPLHDFWSCYDCVARQHTQPHGTCEVSQGNFRVSGGKNSTFHPHNPDNSASANYSQYKPRGNDDPLDLIEDVLLLQELPKSSTRTVAIFRKLAALSEKLEG